jgi:restriction endonuclease
MEIKLELLKYQETAIKSVVDVFDGNVGFPCLVPFIN